MINFSVKVICFIISVIFFIPVYAGEHTANISQVSEADSFAKEYSLLSDLLEKVQNSESAINYRSQIAQELDRLRAIQSTGADAFNALSKQEQQEFIKKFQNNNLHCGEVTQVMQERRRILLNPNLNKILGPVIKVIP